MQVNTSAFSAMRPPSEFCTRFTNSPVKFSLATPSSTFTSIRPQPAGTTLSSMSSRLGPLASSITAVLMSGLA